MDRGAPISQAAMALVVGAVVDVEEEREEPRNQR